MRGGRRRGYTLAEIILVSGLFAMVSVVFLEVLVLVTGVHVRESGAYEVSSQSLYLLQTVQQEVERSSLIEMQQDEATSTLKLRMANPAEDPALIYASGTAVYRRYATRTPEAITSDKASVSGLTFTKRANPPGRDSVSLSFTVTYGGASGGQPFRQFMRGSVARTIAATFDSNIVASTTDIYKIGTQSAEWQSINNTIFFSGVNMGIAGRPISALQRLEVDGGVRLNTVISKPSCNANNRGTFWVTQSGVGVKDGVEVCVRNAGGAHIWVQIPTPEAVWATTTPYPNAISYHPMAAYNGFLYVVGGCKWTDCSAHTSDVRYALVNSSGTVGAWSLGTSYPNVIGVHGMTAAQAYLYVVGGCPITGNCTSFVTSTVRYARIQGDGSLGAWTATTPYPSVIGWSSLVAQNGIVYAVGGCTSLQSAGECQATTSTVRYARIQGDGSLGAWTATTPYSNSIGLNTVVVSKNFIYSIGGCSSSPCASSTSTVRYAQVQGDGSLGAWTATTPYPYGLGDAAVVAFASEGYIHVVSYGDAYTADMAGDGSLGPWRTAVSYPGAIEAYAGVAYNGHAYIVGGWDGSIYTSTVRHRTLP